MTGRKDSLKFGKGSVRGRMPIGFYKVSINGVYSDGARFCKIYHTISTSEENAIDKAEGMAMTDMNVKIITGSTAKLLYEDIII